jgi:AcrR family transcriptional regulator
VAVKPASKPARKRVPAAETREALVTAAMHEFARGGLNGTPVERIARRVGVAQPYVFTLFPTKRELFLAAVERAFQHTRELFDDAAEEFRAGRGPSDCEDVLNAMGRRYREMLSSERERDWLMIQHQAYAACGDPDVRERVSDLFAELVKQVQALADVEPERLDAFFSYGMWLNVAAALGVEDLSFASDWIAKREAKPKRGRSRSRG